MKRIMLAAIIVAAALLQGCATSRSTVDVQTPNTGTVSQAHTGPSLYIRNVTDQRHFEEAPRSADIPSLGFEGAEAATDELKSRAIGRKRNGYGKALGDVLLPEDKTITELVRVYASEGFEDAGWNVVNSADASDDVTTVDIGVTRFWTWVKPGFWAIALNTDIETEFTFSDARQLEPIHAHLKDRMQMVVDSDWATSNQLTLESYRQAIAQKATP
ncbi:MULTISPECIES: flagellar biosynthesis protein [unclassified Halomonas]|uniref:flagellar biosynthesis protein n=2 Tax=Pseudomonadota TaxID=1224 RepID=UPI000F601BFC|nr:MULTISPECIES: flagellar biosynthesis protein [unclassified Halomonas]MBR9772189.1 flagellar biosynthesis protein [Gammaproteobacteria bacterium]MBY5942485.1 hypothetical protein [Halomonas sp. DP5N14-9]MBY6112410.1 hypothetical protein [Halomonas sp. DP1Y21-3]MCJ8287696.1 hypothetical protein [Halomonas sp.]NQY72415.1 flagellar biosynthesis protein [Halomonas sp.]